MLLTGKEMLKFLRKHGFKEVQQVKVKIRSVENGKISLTMKGLEAKEEEETPARFEYKSSGEVSTGLGALLKGLKL